MIDVALDRFLTFKELTDLLEAFATEYPELMELSSIGGSYEGRPIWLATLTNRSTGPHHEKPAIWIDANIHATELAGSVAAIHLINRIVTGFGHDRRVTRALDSRCFYVVPRLNPDGAELAMGSPPHSLRSSVRPYPRPDQGDGLVTEDIDGDGRILTMRIPDPNGAWMVSEHDPRLLVPRSPEDDEPGPYYRLLREGRVHNFDGVTVLDAPNRFGLDLNRNYPLDWRPETDQHGAGPYPTSEPEIRAEVQAIVERPNVCAFISHHTWSGVHLRPYSHKPDDAISHVDLRVFGMIGDAATDLTGYETISVYHGYRHDPSRWNTGVSHDWAYDHLGIYAWATELWSPQRAAGITDYRVPGCGMDHPLEDDLKLLAWSDHDLEGEGFVDWYP
ncbi:MAG: M14 family metallopeptidase, partial [Actinobacteria bacterium]|nr:M14 family metallopeptidase [Actinomycetota bacterium]